MSWIAEIMRRILFLPPAASTVAREIDWLHFAVITTTMLGAAGIGIAGVYFSIRFRARGDHDPGAAHPAAPHPPLWFELVLIAGLFTLFVAFWAVGFWQYVKVVEPPAEAMDVYVTAKQWMWKFNYPDGNQSINVLYAPAGHPVRLLLTSRDVIHSFFMPDFRLKYDAIPGRYTTTWFSATRPGRHHIFCAEYCGLKHSGMRAELIVLSERDFARWSQHGDRVPRSGEDTLAQREGEPSMAARGERIAAAHGCLRCHTVDGSPHIGPTWAGLYQSTIPLANGGTTVADVAYLTESMMDPVAKVHRGFNPVMPSYFGFLKPPEVGAIVEFIKSLRHPPGQLASAPQPLLDGGVYVAPTPGEKPEPAGAIGPGPGQNKQTLEERERAAPDEQAPVQMNPIPLAPRKTLEGVMEQHDEVPPSNGTGSTP